MHAVSIPRNYPTKSLALTQPAGVVRGEIGRFSHLTSSPVNSVTDLGPEVPPSTAYLERIAHRKQELDVAEFVFNFVRTKAAQSNDFVIPSWAAFEQSVQDTGVDDVYTHVHGVMPVLNAVASDISTINTTMLRMQKVAEVVTPNKPISISCDEALYCKAYDLIAANPDQFSKIVLRLGTFHIAYNYIKAIGKYVKDSGMEEILGDSSVYGDGTAEKVMEGKHYARCLRAHFMMSEALWRKMWEMFVEWIQMEHHQLKESSTVATALEELINAFKNKGAHEGKKPEYISLFAAVQTSKLVDQWREFEAQLPPTFQFWVQYRDMVRILQDFIRADREQDWKLHLASFSEMLEYMSALDRTHYTRWGVPYLMDMLGS